MAFEPRISFYEATARQRLEGILDAESFVEWIPPTERQISPHLDFFQVPVAFDDGVVIGEGRFEGEKVFCFAQEGKFRGGSLGEIHAARILGLLKRALRDKPKAVFALFDSGGVRLEEANAGEIGAAELIRAILDVRTAGIPVIGLIGGATGCFGGSSLVSCCCDCLIASEEGRLSVSGPEVIETVMGVEAFDSRNKPLVWRTTGGKNRYLFGTVSILVRDHIPAFRLALSSVVSHHRPIDLETLEAKQAALEERIRLYGGCSDAFEVWEKMGLPSKSIPDLEAEEIMAMRKESHENQ